MFNHLSQKIRVAYIPNFASVASDLFNQFRLAMLTAFSNDADLEFRHSLLKCTTLDDLCSFVAQLPPHSLIFVFDQLNSIEESSKSVPSDLRSAAESFVHKVLFVFDIHQSCREFPYFGCSHPF
jgi:hypothetical protein